MNFVKQVLKGKLIDDGLLPIKCPLHQNFAKEIESQKGEPFTLDDVWRLEKVHNRRIGLIVDSTKTNRYYDWTEVTARETKYKKVPLEVPDNLTEMPFAIGNGQVVNLSVLIVNIIYKYNLKIFIVY